MQTSFQSPPTASIDVRTELGGSVLSLPFTIKHVGRLCLISSGVETKLHLAGVLGGWRKEAVPVEAPKQLLLFVYATQQHTSGGVPHQRCAGPPDSPLLDV